MAHRCAMTHAPSIIASGHCPICNRAVDFVEVAPGFREHLMCAGCPRASSVPRERALMLALNRHAPDWRRLRIHESSPANRGVSPLLQAQCPGYVATQYLPGVPGGATRNGVRCENLEAQTFADGRFDVIITQDVMEHLFAPDRAMQECARTLAPGGVVLFTAPTSSAMEVTTPVAVRRPDGSIEHLAEPEYHGNPVDPEGSLVVWHYGYDLPDLIRGWSGLDVLVERRSDAAHGVMGPMTEVYVCRKPGEPPARRLWGL